MRSRAALSLVTLLPFFIPAARAQLWELEDSYVGDDFLSTWTWETENDPTHGRVNYLDLDTSLAANLTYASHNKFVMRADAQNVVADSARGRDSIRIHSNKAYTESLIILDLEHMPEGCATWPAFWTLSQKGPWPQGGELDIIEGVNLNAANLASLHTTPNCTMPAGRSMLGNATSVDCDTQFNFNQGCGVSFRTPGSYGAPFNAADGGFFAVARTGPDSASAPWPFTASPGIRVWFWPRHSPSVPLEVRFPPGYGAPLAGPTHAWGTPEAEFPLETDNCGYDAHFDAHQLVFDLTFCGDWAGSSGVYGTSGCPSDCTAFVNNNATAFANAYWEVNALHVYTPAFQ